LMVDNVYNDIQERTPTDDYILEWKAVVGVLT